MSRKIQFACLFLLLAPLSAAAQSASVQPPPQPLNFGNNFFVTGDYVVAGARLNEEVNNGFATGTIKIPDGNPGIRGTKSVPAGAQIVAALLYWQTVEKSTTIPGQNGSGQNGFFRPVYQGGPQTGYLISGVYLTSQNPVPYRNGSCTGNLTGNVVRTYRADVRAYLPQDANGDVQVNGVVSGITYGTYKVRLPSNGDGTPNTLGATLVIIYRVLSPDVKLQAIVIYDGTSAPGSALTMTQKVQGFYQVANSPVSRLTHIVGQGDDDEYQTVYLNSKQLPSLYGSGQPAFPGYYGSWDNPTWTFPDSKYPLIGNPVLPGSTLPITTQVVPAKSTEGCVSWGAVIVSTTVKNTDNDGLLDVWKTNHGYCDASVNEGVCSPGDPSWVDLSGAALGQKDVFVQLDYMCKKVTGPVSCDTTTLGSYSFDPSLSADGTNAVQKVVDAFKSSANHAPVNLHVIPTHAIQEQLCTDFLGSPQQLCPFPGNQPGVVGWPGGFVFYENQFVDPTTGLLCLTSPIPTNCVPVFQHGKKDSYHHSFFAHALALPNWTVQSGTLTSVVQSGKTVTFTTSTPHGLMNDPTCANGLGRVTVAYAITNLNMNDTFCVTVIGPPATSTTFTINIGGNSTNATYTRLTDPNLAVASGQAGTISGFSDIGGAHSLITLGSWGPDGQTWQVKAGTFMHELGHSIGLTHGGLFLDNVSKNPNDYTPTVEANCKPNLQSVMNYLFQVDLLDNGSLSNVPDYSGQALTTLNEKNATSSPFANPAYQSTSWYVPTVVGSPSAASQHCDGTPKLINDKPMARTTLPTSLLSFSAAQDINFDGNGTESIRGHNDWTGTAASPGIDLRQISATGTLSAPGLGGSLGGGGGLGGKNLGGGGGLSGLLGGGGGLTGKALGGGGGLGGSLGGGGGLGGKTLGGGGGVSELSRTTANSVTRSPRNLTASEAGSARTITLNWIQPTFGQIGQYNISRSVDNGATFSSLTSVPGTQLTYLDTVMCNPTGYRYFVTAVLAGTSQESVPSNIAPLTTPPLLTGCYTNTPPTVALTGFSSPAAGATFIQGDSVAVVWPLQDDDTAAFVNRSAASTTLLAIGPIPHDGACPQTAPAGPTITLSSAGGGITFGANQFTFNWNTTGFGAGCYFFKLNLDSGQSETSSALQLLINVGPTSLPDGVAGTAYNSMLTESGGVAPFTWTWTPDTGSSLPPGISLNANTGALTGIPTTAGTYHFTARVTDANLNYGTRAFTLHVMIGITPPSLPDGVAGSAYSNALTAVGATGAVTWSITSGALPTGIALGANTGALTGPPAAAGNYNFTARVTDSAGNVGTRAFTLHVAIGITPPSLPDGVAGSAYNNALTAVGAAPGTVTWSITSGALPTGINIGVNTGALSGTPTTAGSYNFTAQVTDSAGNLGTQAFTLRVNIGITPTSLPYGVVGIAYSSALTAVGAAPGTVTWSITSGALPTGIALGVNTGALTGPPTTPGSYDFTVQVTDSAGNVGTQALTLHVVTALPVAQVNQPLAPEGSVPGASGFALTVNGTGFVPGSAVLWNGSPRITTFNSAKQLTATILAADIANLGTASISVANAGSPSSNVDFFQITNPTTAVSLSRADFATGASPHGLISADFNADGRLDLAIANTGDDTVSILLGNGDGTFTASTLATGSEPYSLIAGDFNNDGKLDLAVANFASGASSTVSILLGNGDGTFQTPAPTYAVGSGPISVVTGDFNGDGKLDLAVANQNDHSVSILLGNGDGPFQPHADYPAGGSDVAGVAVGDFNGDGKLDLAVTNPSTDQVSILLGNGDGTFQSPVAYSTGAAGSHPIAVNAADFNGDGILDLAVTNLNVNTVAIFLGVGDGTFQPQVSYPTTGGMTGPSAMTNGDFNGDGKVDLAITDQHDNSVSILLGNGDGTFQSPLAFTTGNFASGVAAGDFNGDGRLDVAVANISDNTVSVMLQPQVLLVPSVLAFGGVSVGGTSTPSVVSLTNNGPTALTISSVAFGGTNAGDFSQNNNCPMSPSTLAAGSNCTISVTFNPTISGPRSATLIITDTATDSPQIVNISGTGTP